MRNRINKGFGEEESNRCWGEFEQSQADWACGGQECGSNARSGKASLGRRCLNQDLKEVKGQHLNPKLICLPGVPSSEGEQTCSQTAITADAP